MPQQTSDPELGESEAADDPSEPLLSRRWQAIVATPLVLISVGAALGIARYAWKHGDTNLTQLKLPEIFLISAVVAVLVLVPWHRTGLQLKKIGWVEFDRIVRTQKCCLSESLAQIITLNGVSR